MTEQELVASIATEAIRTVAPEEMPVFEAVQQVYFARGGTASVVAPTRESELGFGFGGELVALSPAALAIASEVVSFVANHMGEALKRETGAVISDRTRALFKRFGGKPSAGLTPDQLNRVRSVAAEKAAALRIPASKAGLLVDAIVGGLAVSE